MNSKTKQCQNCKSKFVIDSADFEFYKKIDVPEPTWCPDCRMRRRLAFRNEKTLHKRRDDRTGKEIFAMFNSKSSIKVYERKDWWSDKWDAMEYGMEYNFNKPFFEQFDQLRRKVPFPSMVVLEPMVNSDYCLGSAWLKNCYLLSGSADGEDAAYGNRNFYFKDAYDNNNIYHCEICYDSLMLTKCYKAFYCSNCSDSQEIYFSRNLVNCQNCFGCINLKNKKYHIFNQPYSKKEYLEKIKEFDLDSYSFIEKQKQDIKKYYLKFPEKYMHGRKNVNVTGDYIDNSKNTFDSFHVIGAEDSRYCQVGDSPAIKDCYDILDSGFNMELSYETVTSGAMVSNQKFVYNCYDYCYNLEYCMECHTSSNLFGCIGLRKKQYCIFNKQYTKEEYQELVPKIKKHMDEMPYKDKKGRVYRYGEFFPLEFSPYGHNEALSLEHFPLTEKQAKEQGFNWYAKSKIEYGATIKTEDLPDSIKDVDDKILGEMIKCRNEECYGPGAFKLIAQELKFYKKHNIPLPHFCSECRYQERIKLKNPWKLWQRQCQCAGDRSDNKIYRNEVEHVHKSKHCPNKFQTSYAPDRKETIYCEQCYNKETS